MDANTYNNGYEPVDRLKGLDRAADETYRKNLHKKLLIILLSFIALAVIAAVITIPILLVQNNNNNNNNNKSSSKTPPSTATSSAVALKAVCKETLYPDLCYSSISALNLKNTTDPEELFRISLRVAIDSIHSLSNTLAAKKDTTTAANKALDVCQDVLDDALDRLNDSLSSTKVLSLTNIRDLKTWLSTTITDQDTCLDALDEFNATALIGDSMTKPTQYASNSLSIVAKILGVLAKFDVPVHRRLLGIGHTGGPGFPEWVSLGDRRLLQQANPRPDVTVAKDGTGDCTTIKEAVQRIPKKSNNRFVIYVKAGKYVENNTLDKSMWNVMIYGDGKDKTILSGSLNFIDGTPTFHTATFAVAGKGFMAKDMAFKNTAGPEKHQAVAFRSGSDYSVFYRCKFEAFQDTLYAHSNRQFYRECDITGTVDFIFGNAAVVFQKCNIQPRQPMEKQYVTITAQGRKDPHQETGISIQKSTISAFDELNAPVYLGRPWKNFSTTVIMQSNIGAFVKPLGWIEWVSGVEPPNTIMYAEYANTGPGAALGGRVKWAGYKVPFAAKDASNFTVGNFIEGSTWLPATNVPFDLTL